MHKEIENAFERVPHLFEDAGGRRQLANRIETRFDFGRVDRRPDQPRSQQARAHSGPRAIENAEQGIF